MLYNNPLSNFLVIFLSAMFVHSFYDEQLVIEKILRKQNDLIKFHKLEEINELKKISNNNYACFHLNSQLHVLDDDENAVNHNFLLIIKIILERHRRIN